MDHEIAEIAKRLGHRPDIAFAQLHKVGRQIEAIRVAVESYLGQEYTELVGDILDDIKEILEEGK